MFTDDRFVTYINDRFPATGEIRRLKTGAIDYDHYVRIGRAARGTAVRTTMRATAALCRRCVRAIASRRPATRKQAPQPVLLVLAPPARLQIGRYSETAGRTPRPYPEAA